MSTQHPLTRRFLFPLLAACLSVAGCDDGDSSGGGGRYPGAEPDDPVPEGPSCTNTCEYADDGDCDDGGPGSDFSICAFGSDCNDCGPRTGEAPPPSEDGDGGEGEPPAETWACAYVHHSRTACPGYPSDILESERCVDVTAASTAEAEAACSEYTASDTDCYGSCCTRSYGTDRSVLRGGCD